MAFGDPKLPRAAIRDENLYIEGEQEPYFRDLQSTIWLRVDSLIVFRGYESEDPTERTSKAQIEYLRGVAKLEDRDSFGVAGCATDPKAPIKFHLQSVADGETKFHWRANIGFHPSDWEAGRDDEFWIQGYCTKEYFDDLLASVRRGYVDHIRVGMETTMWTRDKASMVATPRTWHVAPPIDRESSRPAIEHGHILSLTWEETFGELRMKESEGEPPASKVQIIDLPGRVYSMLSVLIAICAAIFVLVLLRH